MKKVFLGLIVAIMVSSSIPREAHAVVDPITRENNFVGIHILFPSEITQARDLINSSGGEWGYVTVPIQITDRDIDKWQLFMNEARAQKIIPILRIATEPYFANTSVWRRPSDFDIVDQANFLNSLVWPTKNRYTIVFNEMNRFDEWGGTNPAPEEYAEVLMYTYDAFKKRSQDFYIIMGGLDNGAPTDGKHLNSFQYLEKMYTHNNDVFNKMDGFSSHSYPNPGFAAPPSEKRMSVATYRYEYDYINSRVFSKKPAFITETGWDSNAVGEGKTALYFRDTFETIWNADRDKIVAVTPFLLNSAGGSFDKFSFLKSGSQTEMYTTVKGMAKTRGNPELNPVPPPVTKKQNIVEKRFSLNYHTPNPQLATKALKLYAKAVFAN